LFKDHLSSTLGKLYTFIWQEKFLYTWATVQGLTTGLFDGF